MSKTKEQLVIEGTDARWLSGEQLSWLSRAQLSWLSRAQLETIEAMKAVPKLDKPYTQIMAAINGQGKLEMATWHTCETTHCLGGWTVVLTPKGREFETKCNDTGTAAALILRASRPDAPLPNFTASNEAAMAFLEQRASEEK